MNIDEHWCTLMHIDENWWTSTQKSAKCHELCTCQSPFLVLEGHQRVLIRFFEAGCGSAEVNGFEHISCWPKGRGTAVASGHLTLMSYDVMINPQFCNGKICSCLETSFQWHVYSDLSLDGSRSSIPYNGLKWMVSDTWKLWWRMLLLVDPIWVPFKVVEHGNSRSYGVSENRGTPSYHPVFVGFSRINHPQTGVPPVKKTTESNGASRTVRWLWVAKASHQRCTPGKKNLVLDLFDHQKKMKKGDALQKLNISPECGIIF